MSFFEDMKKSIEQEAIEAGRLNPDEISKARQTSEDEPGQTSKDEKPEQTGTAFRSEQRRTAEKEYKEKSTSTDQPIPELTKDNIEEYILTCPKDDKDRAIVPDHIFDEYYKILPNGTRNETGNKQARNGGILKPFGADPEAEKDIQRKGGEALQAQLKQRRTMAEDLIIMLSQKASPEIIATLGLKADATNQEAVTAAAIQEAITGNIKAGQFVRDTIGEQPTAKQDLSVTMTDDDKRLLEKVEARLNS